jgi:hypothetical protein
VSPSASDNLDPEVDLLARHRGFNRFWRPFLARRDWREGLFLVNPYKYFHCSV